MVVGMKTEVSVASAVLASIRSLLGLSSGEGRVEDELVCMDGCWETYVL